MISKGCNPSPLYSLPRASGQGIDIPEEIKLIQRAPVVRDQDGWWSHPDIPSLDGGEDPAPYMTWATEQGLELKTWGMDSDLVEHPYFDGAGHCNGWDPESPGPEWFLMGIFDTEDGPHVQWARREVTP